MIDDPLRQIDRPFVGSIALLRRLVCDDEQWLALWDAEAGAFRLPIARRRAGDSYRSCLHPVLKDLGLDSTRDYVIAGLSRTHFQAPIEWSGDTPPQWVIVEFFAVDLYGRRAVHHLDGVPGACWLTMSEVSRGTTANGEPICSRQRTLIERTDLLPAAHRRT